MVKGVVVGRKQVWRMVGEGESVRMAVVASLVRGSRESMTVGFSLRARC